MGKKVEEQVEATPAQIEVSRLYWDLLNLWDKEAKREEARIARLPVRKCSACGRVAKLHSTRPDLCKKDYEYLKAIYGLGRLRSFNRKALLQLAVDRKEHEKRNRKLKSMNIRYGIPRDAQGIKCECGGYAELGELTEEESYGESCRFHGCCRCVFVCCICGRRTLCEREAPSYC